MATKTPLYMETTEIPAERTASEIASVLIRAGATQIATDYSNGKVTGLRWSMRAAGKDLLFAMPARVEPLYQILLKRSDPWRVDKDKLRAKAERVAWRQLLRWVQAQVALIECGMTEATEVFFPYMMHMQAGKTVYRLFADQEFRMLPPPETPQ